MLESGFLLDGRYKIVRQIGKGGSSRVYLAVNERANKQWAVKEVVGSRQMALSSDRDGFVEEVRILRSLRHPNLPEIADVIIQENTFFIVMDYIEGVTLDQLLARSGPQSEQTVVCWAKQLCQVLVYLHSREPAIIYRDMKPSNIMLESDGQLKVVDFGTAREYKRSDVTDTVCLGTTGYAAPEQYAGAEMGQTDERTDIYNLGATLYHLLTGISPSARPFWFPPIRQSNPGLSSGLEQVLQKCTRYDPKQRYQTAMELLYDLEHLEQMDRDWRRKQGRKVKVIIGHLCVVMGLTWGAIWGGISAKLQIRKTYEQILAHADCIEGYEEAVLTDPTRVEAYLGEAQTAGLIDFLLADECLTVEESSCFMRLRGGLETKNRRGEAVTVDVLAQLQKADRTGYEQVCDQIGQAYLFYYEVSVEKDRYGAAAYWFAQAGEADPAAGLYCEIAECLREIGKSRKAEAYSACAKMYQILWERIKALLVEGEKSEIDTKIRIWKEVVRMVSDHAEAFGKACLPEELQQTLTELEQACEQVTDEFVQADAKELKEQISLAKEKLRAI